MTNRKAFPSKIGLTAPTLLMFFITALSLQAGEIESNIARGGLLYDKWYAIADSGPPKVTHPSYPAEGKKKGRGTWRCKECHGWDYNGKDGAYAKGSHFTGIKGIRGAVGKSTEAIIALLKDSTHQYTGDMMNDDHFRDLALFVSRGQVDTSKYIAATGEVNGNQEKGAGYYNTICAKCHGRDGRKIQDMEETVGKVAVTNPWEGLHKIRNGHPASEMLALRALPVDVAVDVLTHARTLPVTK
jgi:thiosulfate dehydrogenase